MSHDSQRPFEPAADENPTRRTILAMGGAAAASVIGWELVEQFHKPRATAFIARGQRYDGPLARTVRDGLRACGFDPRQFRDKRVLLKPNLVEPSRKSPQMTTHPAMIVAAIEVFRGWGAAVSVGEAPGHVRDSQMALYESGVGEALQQEKTLFADLNYEETAFRRNRGGFSTLEGLHFPESVARADFVVSMPKLKTHHWVGLTCCMKNFYGVLPGLMYGWPKNVLHHHGIPQTVLDINCTLPQTLGIVDAIDCMEGDGPILGSLKPMGLVLVGGNLPALDATAARIMDLDPAKVTYLQLAADRLGPIEEFRIVQRGETWQSVASPFALLNEPHLLRLRASSGAGES